MRRRNFARMKRIVGLALCVVMMMGLAACAKQAPALMDTTARTDGRVYVENKLAMDLGEREVRNVCTLPGGNFFVMAQNPKNDYRMEICIVDMAGKLLSSSSLDEKLMNMDKLCAGLDGKPYASEVRYEMDDMPDMPPEQTGEPNAADETPAQEGEASKREEGAKPQAEEAPEENEPAEAEGVSAQSSMARSAFGQENPPKASFFVHRFNPEGKVEVSTELALPSNTSDEGLYCRALQVDEQGRIYVSFGSSELMRFLPDGTHDKTYPMSNVENLVLLPGGDAYVLSYGNDGPALRRVAMDTGEEKARVDTGGFIERIIYNFEDQHVYVYANGLLTRIEDDGAMRDIVYLSDYSLMSPLLNLDSIAFGADETLFFIMQKRMSEYESMLARFNNIPMNWGEREICVLTLRDGKNIPERKVITVSVMFSDYMITQAASAFQSLHPDISIKVREIVSSDEAGIDTMEAYNAYIKRVNTEILTGKAADIIALGNLPYEQYQEKKILVDLAPYIKNDPEFNDENYFMNVLKAYEEDGKQFVLPVTFQATSLVAAGQYQVPRDGMSLEEFIRFCDALPPEKVPIGLSEPSSIFQMLIMPNMDYFLDTKNKTAHLDTPEFIRLLEAAQRIGKRAEAFKIDDNDPASWRQYREFARKNVVFSQISLYDYNLRQQIMWEVDGEGDVIPFPAMDGPGRFFSAGALYGINKAAKDKDACWEFLKFLVSEDYLKMASYGQITINRKVNKMVSDLRIELDKREDGVSIMSDGVREMRVPKLTQEDVDAVNAIIAKLDKPIKYDTRLMELLSEETDAFFDGKKDAQTTAQALQSRMSIYLSE